MKLNTVHIFLFFCVLFLIYSSFIYFEPHIAGDHHVQAKSAAGGKLIWQKYNCQSCHQIYGLGGYLGPDLTNIYSIRKQNETVIKALILSGNRWMPAYDLDETEIQSLLAFFKVTDQSGHADPRLFTIENNGMISHK